MPSSAHFTTSAAPRRSILDLAPLELECMNSLWPLGEATVREIRQRLAVSRPRAYTTIMTIMDRLARKGVVTRRRVGRAYLYRPNLTADEARAHAIEQVVKGFFEGSAQALLELLAGSSQRVTGKGTETVPLAPGEPVRPPPERRDASARAAELFAGTRLDESLL